MRYVVDLRHPLQAPCGAKNRYVQQSRPWECGNPEGISKECGKGGKPASWLSMLSIRRHFHGLLSKCVSQIAAQSGNLVKLQCHCLLRLKAHLNATIAFRF